MRLLLWLFVAGIAFLVLGIYNYGEATRTQETPQTISADQLVREGFGNNAYVTVTKFALRTDSFVVLRKEGSDPKGNWETAYIPIAPARGTATGHAAYTLILQTSKAKSSAELPDLSSTGQLQGVIDPYQSLPSKAKDILSQRYPDVDFSNALILSHEKIPATTQSAFIKIAGGAGLLLLSLFLFARRYSTPIRTSNHDFSESRGRVAY